MIRGAETRLVFLGTLLAICSSGPFFVAPDYLSALQGLHGFSLAQLGYVSGLESLAIGVACAATGFALRRIGWRVMLAAAAVCIAGDVLSIFATTFPSVLAVRTLTGLLGEGPLYAISYAVLGSAANPDRAFGVGVGAVAVVAAVVIALEAELSHLFGAAAVLAPYVGVGFILAITVAASRPTSTIKSSESPSREVYARAGSILASIILWTAAAAAFWAFTSTAATTLGVTEATISKALSIALVVGLIGLIIPVVMSHKVGRVTSVFVATAGLVLSCFLFFSGHALFQLAVALSVLQFCWNVAAVYQLAGAATVDRGGRFSAFGGVAQIAGTALGPLISGSALGRFGYGVLPLAVTAIAIVAFVLFAVAVRTRTPNQGRWRSSPRS